jgi:hypothetical protein
MTVREIIITHLRQVGADGLCCHAYCKSGCAIEDRDFLCGCCSECVPGKWVAEAEIFVPMEKEDEE